MTGIAIRAHKESLGNLAPPASLAPSFNTQTREIADRIQALRNPPSPGSLQLEVVPTSAALPLDERFFEALAGVKILTSQVAMHLGREWRSKLFHQLDSLHDPAEWEDSDQPIQQSSFATFLKAMLDLNPERRPGLGLSHAGHLVAAWKTGQDQLTIEFLASDRVRWVLSQHQDGGAVRFAGETGVARLADDLTQYNPGKWFSNAKK